MDIGTIVVRGDVELRAGPARDSRFRVVTDQADMASPVDGTPEALRDQLHSDVNNEIQSLEIAAQSLVDFPDAPWELKLRLARQCWDEVRHAGLFLRRVLDLGGFLGEFPIINQEWGVVCMFDSLAARLMVQNRVFEGGSLDLIKESSEYWGARGDSETAEIFEGVLTDEIQHVGFGNEWLNQIHRDNPRSILQALTAVNKVKAMAKSLAPEGREMTHETPVNEEDRRLAGFSNG